MSLAEFTGERVIPGKVDIDLWNEHRARYLFAARLGRRKRVLDLGCGSGYGSSEMAPSSLSVVGVDRSAEAIAYAAQHYRAWNVRFLQAAAESLPLRNGAFDLVVAFELIEHLADWRALLDEARRLLAPNGQFIVSTPNRLYYAESRRLSGPNPYHQHEFEFEEFREALAPYFPHVSFFLQNHSSGVVFHPLRGDSTADVRVDPHAVPAEECSFFLAVCALTPQLGAPTFVYMPTAANVLRERGEHIRLLESELETKNEWLADLRQKHQQMVERFRQLEAELEERNQWANELNQELDGAREEIARLNDDLAERALAHEAQVVRLDREKSVIHQQLEASVQELAQCVEILHATEKTVEERTAWAQNLDARVRQLEGMVSAIEASRWFRFGRAFRLGPELRQL
ncbi:MAG: methyltransferase domain-containing protein [Bryobacteraceae bacterium]|nr:methyltransferase domain-containing protein [Bryobacteraceae bacterium]